MDTARQYIADVMERLTVLTATTYDYAVGKLDKNKHSRPGRVEWTYGSIAHEAPTAGNIYTEHQELIVTLWHKGENQDESETNTRTLKNNLLVAVREIALKSFSGGIRVGNFDWLEEAHMHLGRKLEGAIEVPLPVPPRVQKTTVITEVGFRGIAALGTPEAPVEEVVCEDNFEDPEPDPDP